MTENANDAPKFRAWSLSQQKCIVVTEDGGNKAPKCSGTGDDSEKKSQFTMVLNTANPNVDENSVHFVFTEDGQQYALVPDLESDTIAFVNFKESSKHIGAFVKDSFGQGPTYALKVAQSQKCIAANKDGFLSLRPFDRVYPHPDTIFVLSKVYAE